MNTPDVAEQVVDSGVALAGLILVFLGFIITSFEGYTTQQQGAVRKKYQQRAILSLIGFFFALIASGFGFAANWECQHLLIGIAISSLGLACLAMVIVAVKTVTDLFE